MIIEFPVSTFSRKILLKFEKREPIKIDARNIVFQQFGNIRNRTAHQYSSQKLLDTSIKIEVTQKIFKRKIPFFIQAGINLHRFHLHQLLIFIEGQVLAGQKVTAAIQLFYNIYNISEDDLSSESILRKWQRFYSHKKNNYFTKNKHYNNTNFRQQIDYKIRRININNIDNMLMMIVFDNIDCFITTNKKFRYSLFRHLKIYFHKKYLKKSSMILSKEFNLSISQINAAIRNIDVLMKYDRKIGEYIKEQIKICPF